jgi:plastocyanin
MRRLALPLAAVVVLAVAPSASAQGTVIQALDGTQPEEFRWTPPAITIKAGEAVTWTFTGTTAPHNVASKGTNWSLPGAVPVRTPPDTTYAFMTPGVYEYVCEVHLPSMAGTVTVTDASGAPPPPPPPPPLSEQHWVNDQQPPQRLDVADERRPRVSRVRAAAVRNGARVRFRLSERARVRVRFVKAGVTVKSARRWFRSGAHALTVRDRRMRGAYRVEVVAWDRAGNRSARVRERVSVR